MRRPLCLLALLGLPGCASVHTESPCLAPPQHPMVVTEMFFGRDIPGRQPLTDSEWSAFATAVIVREFPDGFTVLDGNGQWADPRTRILAGERTKILIAASTPTDDLAGKIDRIGDAYRTEFHQQSVGVLTWSACGYF